MKTKTRHLASPGLVLFSVLIAGCYSMPRSYGTIWHANIEPIYPAMNYSFANRYQTIDTLKPELKWTDIKKPNQTYDLCVWQDRSGASSESAPFFTATSVSWGTPIYTVTNISANFHQVTRRLQPNTYYNWAVRIREGEKVKAWSAFTQVESKVGGSENHRNYPFGFKTPNG